MHICWPLYIHTCSFWGGLLPACRLPSLLLSDYIIKKVIIILNNVLLNWSKRWYVDMHTHHICPPPPHSLTHPPLLLSSSMTWRQVGAIKYCHDHHIAHRDLKLENFLFENNDPDAELKLIDFGLSRHYRENVRMHRPVGTPYYVAPEVKAAELVREGRHSAALGLNLSIYLYILCMLCFGQVLEGSYTNECDLWSIGVITYMLVSGRPPFFGKDDSETLSRVRYVLLASFRFSSLLPSLQGSHGPFPLICIYLDTPHIHTDRGILVSLHQSLIRFRIKPRTSSVSY